MATDPVIGSFVWVTSSVAFLAAAGAIVRIVDGRRPLAPRDPESPPQEVATR